jgi:uncharacterized protein YeeX (DUF496 family)
MPYVDSTSTYEEVRDAMADNVSWLVEHDLAKAKAFAVAARVWLLVWAFDRSKAGPSEQELASLNKMANDYAQRAEDFVASNNSQSSGRSSVTRLSVRNFRGLN